MEEPKKCTHPDIEVSGYMMANGEYQATCKYCGEEVDIVLWLYEQVRQIKAHLVLD